MQPGTNPVQDTTSPADGISGQKDLSKLSPEDILQQAGLISPATEHKSRMPMIIALIVLVIGLCAGAYFFTGSLAEQTRSESGSNQAGNQ